MRKEVDKLAVIDVSADVVQLFLHDLEQVGKCGTATRNQRLAAIHSLARYIPAAGLGRLAMASHAVGAMALTPFHFSVL